MKKKLIMLILSGLLALMLAGCGNSLSGIQTPSGNGKVTDDTSPDTSAEALQERDQNQDASAAGDEAPFRGSVVNIFDNTISLLLVKKENSDGRSGDSTTAGDGLESDQKPSGATEAPAAAEPSDTSSTAGTFLYSTAGETSVINVTSDTEITLLSGEQGKLIDIEVGDILLIQMYGSITESITVESKSGVEIIESDNESDTSLPSPPIKPLLPDEPKESNSPSSAESPNS